MAIVPLLVALLAAPQPPLAPPKDNQTVLICTAQERKESAHAESHHDSHACGCTVKEEDVLLDKGESKKGGARQERGLRSGYGRSFLLLLQQQQPVSATDPPAGQLRWPPPPAASVAASGCCAACPSSFGRMAASRPSAALPAFRSQDVTPTAREVEINSF